MNIGSASPASGGGGGIAGDECGLPGASSFASADFAPATGSSEMSTSAMSTFSAPSARDESGVDAARGRIGCLPASAAAIASRRAAERFSRFSPATFFTKAATSSSFTA